MTGILYGEDHKKGDKYYYFDDVRAKETLSKFFDVLNSTNDRSDQSYKTALEKLRQSAGDIIIQIARGEKALVEKADKSNNDADYLMRWYLVFTASEMRHPHALPYLRNLVLTPIPPERSKNPHYYSTTTQETILRTTAIKGIQDLASDGNKEALDTLYELIEIPSRSIRRASVQAILSVVKDHDKTRKKLVSMLPKEEHFLLDLKAVDVNDVEGINEPQKYAQKIVRSTYEKKELRSTYPSPKVAAIHKDKRGTKKVQKKQKQEYN